MRLASVTPPAAEPVTLAEACNHLRLTVGDDDSVVTGLIAAARFACEQRGHLGFLSQTWDYFLDGWGGRVSGFGSGYGFGLGPSAAGLTLYNDAYRASKIRLPLGPVQSVTSVQYLDTAGVLQTLDPANYQVSTGNPGKVSPTQNAVYPPTASQADAVRIRFVVGYGDTAAAVPDLAKVAVKIAMSALYENRAAVVPDGVGALLDSLGCGANLFA